MGAQQGRSAHARAQLSAGTQLRARTQHNAALTGGPCGGHRGEWRGVLGDRLALGVENLGMAFGSQKGRPASVSGGRARTNRKNSESRRESEVNTPRSTLPQLLSPSTILSSFSPLLLPLHSLSFSFPFYLYVLFLEQPHVSEE